MARVSVRAFEDRSRSEGGHAAIVLRGVSRLPNRITFRLSPTDTETASLDAPWAGEAFAPVASRLTDEGVLLTIGPDLADSPELLPGTAVLIEVPELGVEGEFLWPSITPLARPRRRALVVSKGGRVASSHGGLGAGQAVPPRNAPAVNKPTKGAANGVGRGGAPGGDRGGSGKAASAASIVARHPGVGSGTYSPNVASSAALSAASDLRLATSGGTNASRDDADRFVTDRSVVVPIATRSRSDAAGAADNDDNDAREGARLSPEASAAPSERTAAFAAEAPTAAAMAPSASQGGGSLTAREPVAREPVAREPVAREPAATSTAVASDGIPPRLGERRGFIRSRLATAAFTALAVLAVQAAALFALTPTPARLLDDVLAGRFPAHLAAWLPDAAAKRELAPAYASVLAAPEVSPRGVLAHDLPPLTALELASQRLAPGAAAADPEEGAYWLRRYLHATLTSETTRRALTRLGALEAEGHGKPADVETARRLWELSAHVGDEVAMCFLARLFEEGIGTRSDPGIARAWRERARGRCSGSTSAFPPSPATPSAAARSKS